MTRASHVLVGKACGAAGLLLTASVGCGDAGELLGTVAPLPPGTLTVGANGGADAGGLGPFGPAVLVAELVARANNADPTFTPDLRELYFMSTRAGNADIWMSLRDSSDLPWGAPSRVVELSSAQTDETPSVSENGLTIWFSSERPATHAKKNLWVSTRATRQSPWSVPVELSELNSDAAELSPATGGGDSVLAFASDRVAGSASDIFMAQRSDAGWGPAVLVGELQTPEQDWDPCLADGALQIFFSSTRSGSGDLYWSRRATLTEPFGAPLLLSELNTSAVDSDPAVSRDLHTIMFSSNRSGSHQIYEAKR